jgi:hypothetical protein
MEKKIGDTIQVFDYRDSPRTAQKTSLLFGEHLVMIDFSEVDLHDKIIKRIANSEKNLLINFMTVSDFLSLTELEFIQIQNY